MNSQNKNQSHPLIGPHHLRRFAVVYIRQSTKRQIIENSGSTTYQRNLTAVAHSYGWPDSQIKIIDEDLGRSGSSTQGRTGWQKLQDMIDADQVGAVFVVNISRLARQVHDFELFRMRAALHRTLLYSDGRLGDPANSNDAIIAQIMAMVAQFENRKRTEIMMQSKMTKAKTGEIVSRLPVGWIKESDGRFDYDPATEDAIRTIINTFWQTRSIRSTVIALAKAGVQIPCRKREGQLYVKKPTAARVTFILTNPAYTGAYVFAKTQPGGPVPTSGRPKRLKLPEGRWVNIPDQHPAYMTRQEQEEIRSILKKNQFKRRYGDGRGRVATQGLLRCAECNATLAVSHCRRGYSFVCRRLREYAEKPCMSFSSNDLDECIVREVFKVLKAPPIEMLNSALKASHRKKQTRLDWIRSERERLAREESIAQERADVTRGRLPSVHFDALEKLEKILQDKKEFEQKLALKPVAPPNDESEEELEELCRIASEVPRLWQHEAVTHQERKDIVRCLVDHIVVAPTKERIDARIVWKSGAQTPVSVWRARSRHHLIRELYARQLTAVEIKEHLAAGETSSGQIINISIAGIQKSLNRMGLKPAKYSASFLSVRRRAAELDRQGQSLEAIAGYFNEQGFASPSGKSWTHFMVEHLLRDNGQKQEPLENIHRRAITEAHARGLSYGQMAGEFNTKKIRRRGGRHWTANSVAIRWSDLKRMQRKRKKELTDTKLSEAVVLKRSA
ncbi:MAG: recombinase family protein [Candidatus Binatia bacterium]